MSSLAILKGVLLLGLGLWLGLIAANNLLDPGTNQHLIRRMLAMDGIAENSDMGAGLARRATRSTRIPRVLLMCVVIYQICTCLCLVSGASQLLWISLSAELDAGGALEIVNTGLALLSGMWFLFLIGGLWFGYWITLPAVQSVHLTMLLVTISTAVLVNI